MCFRTPLVRPCKDVLFNPLGEGQEASIIESSADHRCKQFANCAKQPLNALKESRIAAGN
eukprot:3195928-Amphidinium_carterae.1